MSLAAALWISSAGGLSGAAADPGASLKDLPAPKRAIVPKVSGKITVDGELSEGLWRKAIGLTPFYLNDGSGRERAKTTVRLAYDPEALYLGWTCEDTEIQATFTDRDSRFWEEEVAEFFVTPQALNRYFELQWNPLGGVFDAIIVNTLDANGISQGFEGDWSFTAKGMTSAVKVEGTVSQASDEDRYWQVEVRVPWKSLGLTAPSAGDVWRANFYRFNRGKDHEPELLSWSPTRFPGFHEPSRFGFLEFGR